MRGCKCNSFIKKRQWYHHSQYTHRVWNNFPWHIAEYGLMSYRHDDTRSNKYAHDSKEPTDDSNRKTQTDITFKKVLPIPLLIFAVEEYSAGYHDQNKYECADKIGGYIVGIDRCCRHEERSAQDKKTDDIGEFFTFRYLVISQITSELFVIEEVHIWVIKIYEFDSINSYRSAKFFTDSSESRSNHTFSWSSGSPL